MARNPEKLETKIWKSPEDKLLIVQGNVGEPNSDLRSSCIRNYKAEVLIVRYDWLLLYKIANHIILLQVPLFSLRSKNLQIAVY